MCVWVYKYPVEIIISKYHHLNLIWCLCFHSHTQLTTHLPPLSLQYNHNPTVFVELTSSSDGGWGLSCYLSARPRLPTRPSLRVSPILLRCKALRGEINFNQSRFPAASGKRVYTSQFWWTRTGLCDFGVKSQVLGPWIGSLFHQRWCAYKYIPSLSLLIREGQQIGFFILS